MNEILIENAVVSKDKRYDYFVDKHGNLCRRPYKFYQDRTFKLILFMLFLAILYFVWTFQNGQCNQAINTINNETELKSLCNNLSLYLNQVQSNLYKNFNTPLNFTFTNG